MIGWFKFGDIDTRNYDHIVVCEGEVDSAPIRLFDEVVIAGKNGTLLIDTGRYDNVLHSYDIIVHEEYVNSLIQLRNDLQSQTGYKTLIDGFNVGESYIARLDSSFIPKQTRNRNAGTLHVEFSRFPQRYLASGKREKIIGETWENVETVSGDIVQVPNTGYKAIRSLKVALELIQSGSGTPSPDNVRPISGRTEVTTYRTGKNLFDLQNVLNDTWVQTSAGTISSISGANVFYTSVPKNTDVIMTMDKGNRFVLVGFESVPTTMMGAHYDNLLYDSASGKLTHSFNTGNNVVIAVYTNRDVANKPTWIQLELGSTATAYKPYQGETYTTDLGRTVYGGTLNVMSGVLKVDRALATLDGTESWYLSNGGMRAYCQSSIFAGAKPNTGNTSLVGLTSNQFVEKTPNNTWDGGVDNIGISLDANKQFCVCKTGQKNMVVADWKAYLTSNPLQVCYELSTPQTYQLTPEQVSLLTGENNIWGDGEVTLTYGDDPYVLINPTPFEAKPLIVITGSGTFTIEDKTLTVLQGTSTFQTIYIDCETMEAWERVDGGIVPRNDYVQNIDDGFPVLKSGVNNITVGTGIMFLRITPRWWRV